MSYVLVGDIGGTKIAASLMDSRMNIVQRKELQSAPYDSEAMFEQLLRCLTDVLKMSGIESVDIDIISLGLPGKVDMKQGIAVYQNNLPWRDFPLRARLKPFFPRAHITMDNDVHMAGLGEWYVRKLEDQMMVYVTISTGISACIISKGQFIRGAGMAGEIGLSVMNEAEDIATLESLASGLAIQRRAKIDNETSLTTKDVMENKDNKEAVEIVKSAAHYISKGIHQILCLVDPHIIVLGGGVINHQPEFINQIKNELELLINNPIQSNWPARIESSIHQANAGLYGAIYAVHKMREEKS